MAQGLKLKAVGTNFSLKDHIYDVLKDGITNMNIYAADANLKLEERKMADQLGISRTPIREALARLEQEGFVLGRNSGYARCSQLFYHAFGCRG